MNQLQRVLGGVAAGAKGVQKVAGMLDTADKLGGAVGTAVGAARMGRGNLAVAAGKNAVAQAKLLNTAEKGNSALIMINKI